MHRIGVILALLLVTAAPAHARMADWHEGIVGLPHTHDGGVKKMASARACSAEALPATERRKMEAEYVRRIVKDGKASADAWVQEQGRRFRMKLVEEGACPPLDADRKVAEDAEPVARKAPRGKDDNMNDKACTRTRVEQRVTPGFGGAPMTMGMVVVCDD